MEALLFMLNSVGIVLVVFMGLRDDRKPPNVPHTSLFRMRDEPDRNLNKKRRAGGAGPDVVDQPDWADWEQAGHPTP